MIFKHGVWICAFCDGIIYRTGDGDVRCLSCGRTILMVDLEEHRTDLARHLDALLSPDTNGNIIPGRAQSGKRGWSVASRRDQVEALMKSLGTFTSQEIEQQTGIMPATARLYIRQFRETRKIRVLERASGNRYQRGRVLYQWVGKQAAVASS